LDCRHYRDLRPYEGRTSNEVELAIRTERNLAKVNANRGRLGVENSKKMLELCSPEMFDERINGQQREMAYLYERLGMGIAMPECIPTMTSKSAAITDENAFPVTTHDESTPMVLQEIEADSEQVDDDFWGDLNDYH